MFHHLRKLIIVPAEGKKSAIEATKEYFVTLASASMVEIAETEENIPEDAVSVVINGAKIFIPLDELVDFEKEKERLTKEKAKLEGEIKRVNGKLSNQGFLAKAPEKLVNEEKAKKEKFEEMMKSVLERLENIDSSLAIEVRKILDLNKSERHIRGGMATKEKYAHMH